MTTRKLINVPDWIEIVEAEVSPGQSYWHLAKVKYEDNQSSGGNHHIYSQEPHNPQVRMLVSFDHRTEAVPLDKPSHEPAGNFPMYGAYYSAMLEGLPSDRIMGMRLPGKHHVNFRLWWEKRVKVATGEEEAGEEEAGEEGKMWPFEESEWPLTATEWEELARVMNYVKQHGPQHEGVGLLFTLTTKLAIKTLAVWP